MRVLSVKIELEVAETDNQNHATEITFREGMWRANGPTYNRINKMLGVLWPILRDCMDDRPPRVEK